MSVRERLPRLLLWLISPHPSIQAPYRRRQSRFLALIILTFLPISLAFGLAYLGNTDANFTGDRIALTGLGIAPILLVSYFLNHRGYYVWGAVLCLMSMYVAVFVSGFPVEDYREAEILYYLLLPNLLASILFSLRTAAIFIIFSQIGAVIAWVAANRIAPTLQIEPITFLTVAALIIAFLTSHRNQLEKDRQIELAESEARYRSLVELCPDGILVTSNHQIVYANRAALELFGAAELSQLEARPAIEFVHVEDRPIVSRRLLEAQEASPLEQRLVRLDGTIVDTEAIGAAIAYEGKPARQTVIRNISERKRVEATLRNTEKQLLQLTLEREKSRLLERFISDASHDLKTPMAAITTSAYLLEKYMEILKQQITPIDPVAAISDKDQSANSTMSVMQTLRAIAERAETLTQSAFRLQRLLDTMLDLIRLENQMDFNFAERNLNSVAAQAVESVRDEADRAKCSLVFNPYTQSLPVRIDEYEMNRLIQHLMENAIRYTGQGEQVSVSIYSQDESAIVEVRDTGIGISAEDMPHIFERFYRADKARSTHTGGTGLGLAIVKKIVEMHHGEITVESVLHEGSVFRVRLPLLSDSAG